MTRTVDALVSAARQEAGLTRAWSDVRAALEHEAASVRGEAEAAGIEIQVSVPPDAVTVAIEDELVERVGGEMPRGRASTAAGSPSRCRSPDVVQAYPGCLGLLSVDKPL